MYTPRLIVYLLLLAAPTWLWGRCGRHNSPPASYVMDLVWRRSDGSHVSIDTVHPSLLRSSSLSSPGWYNLHSLSSDVFLVSSLYVAKPSRSRCPAPLCDTLYLLSLLDVIVSHIILTLWYLIVWPHAHLHIFISVTSNFFTWELVTGTVSIPYSIAGWTIILCIFPFTCGGTILSHRTPAIFLQLFHPHWVLLFISVLMPPSLCRVLPRLIDRSSSPAACMYNLFLLHEMSLIFEKKTRDILNCFIISRDIFWKRG